MDHHYVPKYYIKKCAGSDGKVFRYKLVNGKLDQGRFLQLGLVPYPHSKRG